MAETHDSDLHEVCSFQLRGKESIIDGISDALMLLDVGAYRILDVNEACLKAYKTTRERILGRTCHEVTHHLDRPCSQVFKDHTCPLEQCVLTGSLCMTGHTHKDREGNQLYFEITAYPLKDGEGKVDRIVHLSIDVTDRKRAEEALKEASEKIKLFAYSVAHDLKSPVIGLHGLTKRLHDKYKDVLDEKGKDLCQRILRASEQVAEFTNTLYDEWPLRKPDKIANHRQSHGPVAMSSLDILSADIPLAERMMYIAMDTWFLKKHFALQLQQARDHVEKRIEALRRLNLQ